MNKIPYVFWSAFSGNWEAFNGKETEVFYTQKEAEIFAGVKYDSNNDFKY